MKFILTALLALLATPVFGANNIRINPAYTETAQGAVFPQTVVVTSDSLIKKIVATVDFSPNTANGSWVPSPSLPTDWTATRTLVAGQRGITITAQKNTGANTSGVITLGTLNAVAGRCELSGDNTIRPSVFFIDSTGDTIRPSTTKAQVVTAQCDYVWMDPEGIAVVVGRVARLNAMMSSKRQVAAVAVEFNLVGSGGKPTVRMRNAERGMDIDPDWEFYYYTYPGRNGCGMIGSGFDWIDGDGLEVARFFLDVGECGQVDRIDMLNPDPATSFSGTYLSTLQLETIEAPSGACLTQPWRCTDRTKTLYLTGGSVGAVPCIKPPCRDCDVTLEDLIKVGGKVVP